MTKTYNPSENEAWEVIYPDQRGPVIIRKRRPWPVPFPDIVRAQDEDDYLAEQEDLDVAA